MPRTEKYVYDFAEGNKDLKDLLGGKGANLAEMTNLGLPVPPGFTITTEACQAYLKSRPRAGRARRRGQRAPRGAREDDGQEARPVRRPAAGLGALRRQVLDARDDGDRPQHRAQRRVGARPGRAGGQRAVRLGLLPPADPDVRQDRARHRRRALRGRPRRGQERQGHRRTTSTSTPTTCASSSRRSRRSSSSTPAGRSRRTRASRWTSPSAPSSTRGTPTARSSTAARSASRPTSAPRSTSARWCSATSAWTPAPASPSPATRPAARRASTATTCRTRRARTSSPASATPCRWPTSSSIDKTSYDELLQIMQTLEKHYHDLCDIEFTIERGKLWMLQTRVGKRTAAAAFRIATQLVDEGLIDMDEALQRVTGAQLAQLMFPRFDDKARQEEDRAGHERLARRRGRQGRLRLLHRGQVGARGRDGHPRPPRDQPRRPRRHDRRAGHPHQPRRQDLARRRRRPRHGQDLRLRRRGARGRHQAPHRSAPRTASRSTRATSSRSTARPATSSSARCRSSPRRSCGTSRAATDRRGRRPGRRRRPDHAARRRRAPDVGARQRRQRRGRRARPPLRRAGHRPVPHRAHVPRRAAPAGRAADPRRHRRGAGDASSTSCCRCSARTSSSILEAMDGLPVTIRLLDPPLHEFLPDITELSVRVAVAEARGEKREGDLRMLQAVHQLHEQNPMLGLRGVRLGLVIPGLFAMQARAIAEAAAERHQGRRRAARRDHGAAGRERAGARDGQAGHHPGRPRGARRDRRAPGVPGRHDDRAAARGADRRPDRRGGRVLLLRHQRPHPDDLGLLPRRRRGGVLLRLPGEGHLRRLPVRVARRRGRRRARADRAPRRAARAARASSSASAASTAATRTRCTSSTRSASTTSPARRSACRSRGSRPAARRSRAPEPAESARARRG